MTDLDLFDRINSLSEEEERLWAHAGDGHGLEPAELERMNAIRLELDRVYDLLHQRQALRAAGRDPSEANLRPSETVERYEQ
jgi:hypothetical protein